jgi:MFS family permease
MANTTLKPPSALGPLALPIFRALWIASFVSNLGTLMQGVAAAWLMTSLTTSATPVALLTTAGSLPLFLVGLPAGALADVIDRRRLILLTQLWMLVVAGMLAGFAALGWMTPWLLLALTFILGIGGALSAPAWQAVVPRLVPRSELAAAVALNSAGFNLARAIGPAIGGVIVAASGPAMVFLLNAVSFVGIIFVIYGWKPQEQDRPASGERVGSAVVAGLRYTRYSPPLRVVLLRTAAFIISASALWALLPVIATRGLGLSAGGYGVMLGSIGLGAVGGAGILPRLRARFSPDQIVAATSLVFAAGMCVLAYVQNLVVINLALLAVGVAWLTVTSSLNVAAQTTAPAWVQARALGVYLLVFQGGFAGGGALWGLVADGIGESRTLLAAAAALVAGVAATWRWRLPLGDEFDLSPSQHWPEPELAVAPAENDGPVLVTVEYRVAEADHAAFHEAMAQVQIIRLRDGANQWGLFHDLADPERFLETFLVSSWAEHLRQHERATVADRDVEERALAFQRPGSIPVVSHLIATQSSAPSPVEL